MKPKEARCKFNKARLVYKMFNPVCTWAEETIKQLPPHLSIDSTDETNCKRCKCFKEAES